MEAAACAFAALSGANDGGSLASLGLTVRALPPVAAPAALGAAGPAVPVVFRTAVASTPAGRLVAFDGTTGRRTLLVAIGAAVLSEKGQFRRSWPFSLTGSTRGCCSGQLTDLL